MSELQQLKQRLALQASLDELVEDVTLRRSPLTDGLGEALPRIREALDLPRVWIETLDEALAPRVFSDGPEPAPDLVERAAALGADHAPEGEGVLHARRLDVAGESYGTLAAWGPPAAEEVLQERDALLHTAAEVLDNYLAAVRHAREKQRLLRAIHQALRHPLVPKGIEEAVAHIDTTVKFDLLIVLYHMEEDYQDTLHYLVFRSSELEFASRERVAAELDRLLRTEEQPPGGSALITNAEVEHRRVVGEAIEVEAEDRSEELMRRLGYAECLETVLIGGVQAETSVGKLVVGSRHPLSTYERDVFDLFADVLQKRVVDFSRTGKLLHRTFPLPTVLRLLNQPDFLDQLAPRYAQISILYADVASFTRLSEQVLSEPGQIGALIEAWSRESVRLLWKHGGVFDKLVGDCVIGLFGPPFYEASGPERALACARAAADIVRFTRDILPTLPAAAEITAAGEPLGVAIGINDCPASVGLFGPNQDFTAFAPGMNNAARLQSVAVRDEVLVLEPMRALIEEACPGARFGALREEPVKNVAEPLRFFALDLDSLS